ncbi:MAG TPA: histidine kinase [Mucilaginibacter sp.]|jgi:sensor histidine kinase YesM|nr:histidine kinase [Mucilaginibacter sp.]
MKPMRHLISGNRLVLHTLFSASVLAMLAVGLYFLHVSGFKFETGQALVNCLFFLFCIYTGRWLCQVFYLRKRLVPFIFSSLSAFILLSVIEYILVKYAFHHPNAGFLELLRGDMPFFFAGMVLGMLLKLIRASMQKEIQDAQIKAEQKESELNLLQSQLSPHFLFNVLNNLYGISITEPGRIPQLLLKLSGLLRYSVYGGKKLFVPLKEELDYINSYIEFEQIRMSDRLNLAVAIEKVSDPAIQIAPQVLIVFLENAFKHAKNTLNRKIDIDISLKINGNFICLEVSNSYEPDKSGHDQAAESSGLGLPNTLKRLELLYGSNYNLEQHAENGLYQIELNLKCK